MVGKKSSNEFLALLDPIKDSLYGYAHRAVWKEDQVPDVVQEALMTGWREFHRFQRGSNFRAWMFKILVNTIFRLNKRAHRRREVPLEDGRCELHVVLEREEAWADLLRRPEMIFYRPCDEFTRVADVVAMTPVTSDFWVALTGSRQGLPGGAARRYTALPKEFVAWSVKNR